MEFICLIGDRLFSVKMRINLKKSIWEFDSNVGGRG